MTDKPLRSGRRDPQKERRRISQEKGLLTT